MRIVFHRLAAEEYNDITEYYELEVSGLGRTFKTEVKRVLRTIQNYPAIAPIVESNIRRYLLYKFPFKILYSVEENYIYIIAISHLHREPTYWANRIKSHH